MNAFLRDAHTHTVEHPLDAAERLEARADELANDQAQGRRRERTTVSIPNGEGQAHQPFADATGSQSDSMKGTR